MHATSCKEYTGAIPTCRPNRTEADVRQHGTRQVWRRPVGHVESFALAFHVACSRVVHLYGVVVEHGSTQPVHHVVLRHAV
eukprot:2873284-Pleurochrysis_carterae.AAC.1